MLLVLKMVTKITKFPSNETNMMMTLKITLKTMDTSSNPWNYETTERNGRININFTRYLQGFVAYLVKKEKKCEIISFFYLIGKRVSKILWESLWNFLDCVHSISYIVATLNVAEVDQKVVVRSG